MFQLDFRSRVPIYEQLIEKFKELIIKQVLKPDEQLPPVRVLAGELTVNPNTIQKAYRELERQGYIYSNPGKGNFVMPSIPGNQTVRLENLKMELQRMISEMHYLGMNQEDILSLIKDSIPVDKGGKTDD